MVIKPVIKNNSYGISNDRNGVNRISIKISSNVSSNIVHIIVASMVHNNKVSSNRSDNNGRK